MTANVATALGLRKRSTPLTRKLLLLPLLIVVTFFWSLIGLSDATKSPSNPVFARRLPRPFVHAISEGTDLVQHVPRGGGGDVKAEAFPSNSSDAVVETTRLISNIAELTTTDPDYDDDTLLEEELTHCGGEIIDPHLHTAPWIDDAKTLVDELQSTNISIGLLYNPYPKVQLPYDVNTFVFGIAEESQGRIFALASLNTTHDDWNKHRLFKMERLRSGLQHACALGTKLAPPHTCLPLNGPIMDDIMIVVNESQQKLIAIHIGTTPFCGPLGKQFGIECDCGDHCVNPSLLIPYIEQYPDVTFVLLHSGHEFLTPDESREFYYNFTNTDECIRMALVYPNVYLSMSALFGIHKDTGDFKYPGGVETVQKMKDRGVTHKVFWGSDASWNRGDIHHNLITSIKAMKCAGWTQKERSWALRGCARYVFKVPPHVS